MTIQELEILSINQLLELREIVDAEIRRKKEIERDEAFKELEKAWKKFREVAPNETCIITVDTQECWGMDIDLYEYMDHCF